MTLPSRLSPLAIILVLISCGDRSPTDNTAPEQGSFALTVPSEVREGQPFAITIVAVAPDGTRPDASFDGAVALTTSAGSLTFDRVDLTDGAGTATIAVLGSTGTVTITAAAAADPTRSGTAVLAIAAAGQAGIEITSDTTFLLTQVGDTARAAALVYDANGRLDADAVVTWTSSDPSIVGVDAAGTLTATAEVGSATVTASSGSFEPRSVSVVVAQTAADTRLVHAAAVLDISADGSRVTLRNTPATAALQVGHIIASNAGILARVTSIQASADGITAITEPARLNEAFLKLSINGATGALPMEARISKRGVAVYSLNGRFAPETFPFGALECTRDGTATADLQFDGGELTLEYDPVIHFEYVLDADENLENMRMYLTDRPTIGVSSATLTLSAETEGSIKCLYELPVALNIPLATFWGIVTATGRLAPAVGFQLEASAKGEVKITTPAPSAGVEWRLGAAYDGLADEWSLINEATPFVDAGTMGDFTEEISAEFAASALVPLIEVAGGLNLKVTVADAAGIDFVKPKIFGSFDVGLAHPFTPGQRDYRGPTWNLAVKGTADISIQLTGAVADALAAFDVETGYEQEGFELFSIPVKSQPAVQVEATATPGVDVMLGASTAAEYEGSSVEFWAFEEGQSSALWIAEGSVDGSGRASASWRAPEEGATYDVVAYLFGSPFSAIRLPYASALTSVTVGEEDEDEPGEGSSYGEPHVLTFDERAYDFMATGDFILARSTAADDFEVQVRYTPHSNEVASLNYAVAARVLGHTVNVYPRDGVPEITIDGEDAGPAPSRSLPGGGALMVNGRIAIITWPDMSMVRVETGSNFIASVKVIVPGSRRNQMEGLLGNFDGSSSDDIRIRDGDVLANPSEEDLYLDFRQSWRVPYGTEASLFSRGPDLWNPFYPPGVVTLDDLDPTAVEFGLAACRAAGVVSQQVLLACAFDVAITGDESWALVAVGVDPDVLRLTVMPGVSYVGTGASHEFGAIVSGTTNRNVSWSSSAGAIAEVTENIMLWTAPDEPGEYTITAILEQNAAITETVTVHVLEGIAGSLTWTGAVDDQWHNPLNWVPNQVPDSLDNVFIPQQAPRYPTSHDEVRMNDLVIEPGASLEMTDQRLIVHGSVDIGGSIITSYPLEMRGTGGTVQGNLDDLAINGTVALSGATTAGRVTIRTGSLDLHGQTLHVQEDFIAGVDYNASHYPGGVLIMRDDADRLIVDGERALFSTEGISGEGLLTAGTIEARTQYFHVSRIFRPSGTHRVIINGTGYQQVSTHPDGWVNDIEFANAGETEIHYIDVRGTATVSAGTVVGYRDDSQGYLHGDLIEAGGAWRVPVTILRGSAQQLPAQMTTTLSVGTYNHQYAPDFSAAVILQSPIELTGDLYVAGGSSFTLNGHSVDVNGNLITETSGGVVLGHEADTLRVAGDAYFGLRATRNVDGGSLLSAGELEVGGNLRVEWNQFRASGTHHTVLSGTAEQGVTLSCGYTNCGTFDGIATWRPFNHLVLDNPAGVIFQGGGLHMTGDLTLATGAAATFNAHARLDGSVDMFGTMAVNAGFTVAILDTLFLRSTAILNNSGTVTTGACETEAGHTITGTDPCG